MIDDARARRIARPVLAFAGVAGLVGALIAAAASPMAAGATAVPIRSESLAAGPGHTGGLARTASGAGQGAAAAAVLSAGAAGTGGDGSPAAAGAALLGGSSAVSVASAASLRGSSAAAIARAASAGCHGKRATRALCLVNRARARAGLRPLRANAQLARAARRHARDMVRHHYFAHQRAGGPSLLARARAAGWRGRRVAEAIAWGCGAPRTARATVRSWLNSPPHRAILLSRAAHHAGLGVSRRAPVSCSPSATWVLDAG